MKLTVEQLLSLVVTEVQKSPSSVAKGRAKDLMRTLHSNLGRMDILDNEVEIESEAQVKNSSRRGSRPKSSSDDAAAT